MNPKREEKNEDYIFSLDVVTVDDARACVTNASRKKGCERRCYLCAPYWCM